MNDPLQQIFTEITKIANDLELPCIVGVELAGRVIERLQKIYPGQGIYIAKTDTKIRNELIRKKFNGVNIKQLCDEYHISKSTLYRILSDKYCANDNKK